MKAIRVQAHGGQDVLQYEEVPEPKPGVGQALVKMHAIGVNFIDVYHRTGLYKLPLPFTPGMEGSGIVESTGSKPGEPRRRSITSTAAAQPKSISAAPSSWRKPAAKLR